MLLVKKFKVTEMEMIVNLKEHSYPIYIEKNILKHANEKIKEVFKGKKIMIISDDQVYPLYGDDLTLNLEKDFKVNHVVVPHGEKSKRFDMLPTLYKACLDFKLTRTDLIIALGGGVNIAPALAGGSRSLRLRSVAGKPGHVLRTKVFYAPGKRFAGRHPIVPNLLRSEKRKEVENYEYAGHRIDRSGVPVWRLCALRPLAG